jgi:hypothetical protein
MVSVVQVMSIDLFHDRGVTNCCVAVLLHFFFLLKVVSKVRIFIKVELKKSHFPSSKITKEFLSFLARCGTEVPTSAYTGA